MLPASKKPSKRTSKKQKKKISNKVPATTRKYKQKKNK